MKRLKEVGIVLFVLWLLLSCATGSPVGIELAGYLGLGWLPFLLRVGFKMHVRWDLVASALVYAIALLVGAHLFLRWVYRELGKEAGTARDLTPRVWQWRWTLSGFVVVVMMFVAGTAAIGIIHQVAWLARSSRPMYVAERASRVKCASNLRRIGQGLEAYVKENGGKYPDNLSLALGKEDVDATVFVCPSSADDIAPGVAREEVAANLMKPGHCSYVYLGKGLKAPVDPERVVAVEPLENHENGGMNVLFGDGHVEWFTEKTSEELLKKLGVERVAQENQ